MSDSSSFSNLSLKTGSKSCAAEVRLTCCYDDPWRTPITDAPVRIEDSSGVLLPGTLGGMTTRGLADFGLTDGHTAVPAYRAQLGTFAEIPAQRGDVRIALVADPAAQGEVNALSEQILSVLASFQTDMEQALLPWVTKWNNDGILSIPEAYRTGAVRGLAEWWKSEADFWVSVGNWVSEAFDAAVNAMTQAAVELWEWYSNLPWYDKLNPIGAYAREQILSLLNGINDLWERREQIMALSRCFVSRSIATIEKGLEALVDFPGEAGEIMSLLVRNSAEWVQGLIEMVRETDVLKKLAGTLFGIIMMMTPNLWAEAIGTIGGYLLPEVLLAVIFVIIAAFTEGAGAPLLLKIFTKLDDIAKLVTQLAKALRRKVDEAVDSATGVVTRIVRKSPKKPRGRRTKIREKEDEETKRSLRRENESADILAKNGYDVEQNPMVPGEKKPDYKIDGEIYDNYAPSSSKPRNISSEVAGKIDSGQTKNIIINLKDSSADLQDLIEQFNDWPINGLGDINIITSNGKVIDL